MKFVLPPPPHCHVRVSKVLDFAKEVVGEKVFLVCNSVGGVAGLQAGVDGSDQVSTRAAVSTECRVEKAKWGIRLEPLERKNYVLRTADQFLRFLVLSISLTVGRNT